MASSTFRVPDVPQGQTSGDFARAIAGQGRPAIPRKTATPSSSRAPSQTPFTNKVTKQPKMKPPQPPKRSAPKVPPISISMHSPRSKRPRLSMCPSVSPDSDLECERTRNDMTLKQKFEQIFDKYGHDFTGIGDEINVMSGEVVVDNGHILGMQDETDTCYDPSIGRRTRPPPETSLVGRSLLLSMSEGGLDSAAVEDVIQSIEIMARETAAEGETSDSVDESEEDPWALVYQEDGHGQSRSGSTDSLLGAGSAHRSPSGYAPDQGSLDGESRQPGSADSLLGNEEQGDEEQDVSVYSDNFPEVSDLVNPVAQSKDVQVAHHLSAQRTSVVSALDGGNDTPWQSLPPWRSDSRSAPVSQRLPRVAPRNIDPAILEGYESDDPLQ